MGQVWDCAGLFGRLVAGMRARRKIGLLTMSPTSRAVKEDDRGSYPVSKYVFLVKSDSSVRISFSALHPY